MTARQWRVGDSNSDVQKRRPSGVVGGLSLSRSHGRSCNVYTVSGACGGPQRRGWTCSWLITKLCCASTLCIFSGCVGRHVTRAHLGQTCSPGNDG